MSVTLNLYLRGVFTALWSAKRRRLRWCWWRWRRGGELSQSLELGGGRTLTWYLIYEWVTKRMTNIRYGWTLTRASPRCSRRRSSRLCTPAEYWSSIFHGHLEIPLTNHCLAPVSSIDLVWFHLLVSVRDTANTLLAIGPAAANLLHLPCFQVRR